MKYSKIRFKTMFKDSEAGRAAFAKVPKEPGGNWVLEIKDGRVDYVFTPGLLLKRSFDLAEMAWYMVSNKYSKELTKELGVDVFGMPEA